MRRFPANQRVLLTLAVICALTLAACDQATGTPYAATPSAGQRMPGMTTSSGVPDQATPVTTDTVAIKEFAFAPGNVTIKVGATITWTNSDQDPHTVTSSGTGGPLKSPTLNTGDSYKYTFDKPGRYDYLCTI